MRNGTCRRLGGPGTRQLRIEGLETRALLAGNVAVSVDGQSLLVTGDNADNDISIALDGTDLVVTGRNNTRINGGTAVFRVASSRVSEHLFGDMKKGNDVVSISGFTLSGKIQMKTRQGNDRIEVQNVTVRDLALDSDGGDDVMQIVNVTANRDAWLFLGEGNDMLAAPSLDVGATWRIKAKGAGNNVVVMGELQVGGPTRLDFGSGNDQLAFVDDLQLSGRTSIAMRGGNDVVAVNPTRGSGTGALNGLTGIELGRGNDVLTFDTAVTANANVNINGDRGDDQVSGNLVDPSTRVQLRRVENRTAANVMALVDNALAALARAGIDVNLFGNVQRQAPVVTLADGSVTYVENATSVPIDANLTVTDADSPRLQRAMVAITSGFAAGQDELTFTSSGGITGSYNASTGILTLTGDAPIAAWQQVLRTVTYRNTSEDPSTANRTIRVTANDGTLEGSDERTIQLTAVDDAGNLTLPGEFGTGALVQRNVGSQFQFTATVNDPDDMDYTFQLDLEQSGLPAGAAQPTIDATTGQLTWTPNMTGTFTIRIIATNGAGFSDQETFRIQIV